jgi:hypothetical protein
MRFGMNLIGGLGLLLSIVGCEQRIPKEELGTVVFEVPAVPGAEKPPPMPELEAARGSQTAPPGKPP